MVELSKKIRDICLHNAAQWCREKQRRPLAYRAPTNPTFSSLLHEHRGSFYNTYITDATAPTPTRPCNAMQCSAMRPPHPLQHFFPPLSPARARHILSHAVQYSTVLRRICAVSVLLITPAASPTSTLFLPQRGSQPPTRPSPAQRIAVRAGACEMRAPRSGRVGSVWS